MFTLGLVLILGEFLRTFSRLSKVRMRRKLRGNNPGAIDMLRIYSVPGMCQMLLHTTSCMCSTKALLGWDWYLHPHWASWAFGSLCFLNPTPAISFSLKNQLMASLALFTRFVPCGVLLQFRDENKESPLCQGTGFPGWNQVQTAGCWWASHVTSCHEIPYCLF